MAVLNKLRLVKGETVMNRVRYNVCKIAQESGKSLPELSSDSVSHKTFWNLCCGQRDTRVANLIEMARILGCSPTEFFNFLPSELADYEGDDELLESAQWIE